MLDLDISFSYVDIFRKIVKNIPTVIKKLNRPNLEDMTLYPVEKSFFIGSKVLFNMKTPRDREAPASNMIIEFVNKYNTRMNISWDIPTTLISIFFTNLVKLNFAKNMNPMLIRIKDTNNIHKPLTQTYTNDLYRAIRMLLFSAS
jgi:hypothetical protein